MHLITSLSPLKVRVACKPYGVNEAHSAYYASAPPLMVDRADVYDGVLCEIIGLFNATSSGQNPKLVRRENNHPGAVSAILETGHTLNSNGLGTGTGEMSSHPLYPVPSRNTYVAGVPAILGRV